MADDLQERTEEATPKKKQESKRKGQVPRSRDLNTLLMLLAGVSALLLWTGNWVNAWHRSTQTTWNLARHPDLSAMRLLGILLHFLTEMIWTLAPFLGLMWLVAVLAPAALGGWTLSGEALAPKFNRLDPIQGTKRLFSIRSLVELLKTLGKFSLISGAAIVVFLALQERFLLLGTEPPPNGIRHAAELLAWGTLSISSTLLIIALLDVPYQLWEHRRKLRMTRQEVKEEFKQSEGDPQQKARIRQVQRELANRRMMEQVASASVIITNPDHYAVALRYVADRMHAPVVVAKGRDLVAGQIKERGMTHQVPVVRAPVLSRALYFTTQLDQPIPEGLFVAVAQILAYLYQLDQMHGGRPKAPRETDYPGTLSIPVEYRRAADRNQRENQPPDPGNNP